MTPPAALSAGAASSTPPLVTPAPKKVSTVKKAPPAPAPVPAPAPPPAPPPAVKSADLYAKALGAVVNIFCVDTAANAYIMASGAIIDPAGYVLTNGHVAVHFNDPGTDCVLRRGSPARNFARAKVVFLPNQAPKIGGSDIPQNDAAILKITQMTDGSPAPPAGGFEYFKIDPAYAVVLGETLYALNYPTEFLGAETALKDAGLVFSQGTVESIVTVDDDASNAEAVYLKGELSVQHGSSGGIFLDSQKGEVVGLFVGLTEGKTTAERKQFMFMSSYIDRIVRAAKGLSLAAYVDTNP
jgi:S1-C subfamily serine protease